MDLLLFFLRPSSTGKPPKNIRKTATNQEIIAPDSTDRISSTRN